MERRIHLLHGIHTSEGDSNVSKLIAYLSEGTGLEVRYHQYGYAYALLTRFQNPGRAEKIAKEVKTGDIVVGHSNGATIAYLMIKNCGVRPDGLVLINPALDVDIKFPKAFLWADIYHNMDDAAVSMAELFFFKHPWGAMGQWGYSGASDGRVTNIDCQAVPGMPRVAGHSAIFQPWLLSKWGPYMAARINAHIKRS